MSFPTIHFTPARCTGRVSCSWEDDASCFGQKTELDAGTPERIDYRETRYYGGLRSDFVHVLGTSAKLG